MRQAKRKMTEDPIILRITDMLKIQNRTEKELVQYLGLSNSAFSSWKFENSKGYEKRIDEIAEFLGVTKKYLLEGIDDLVNMDTITGTEIKLVKLYRNMGNKERKSLMRICEYLVNSTKYERINAVTLEEVDT